MLKLKFNQDLIPVNLTKETAGKDMVWQRTYGAYLCKFRKANYGEFFTNLEEENLESLVIPFENDNMVEGAPSAGDAPPVSATQPEESKLVEEQK